MYSSIGSKTVANLRSVIHILPSFPELQTKFAALSYEFKLMIHRTYSFVSRWKLINLQSSFLSIRCASDPSNLIKEWRNILWNAWWWKHMEMNSRRNTPFTVKYVSATMISKNISRAYPITACWFHGRLWNFEEMEVRNSILVVIIGPTPGYTGYSRKVWVEFRIWSLLGQNRYSRSRVRVGKFRYPTSPWLLSTHNVQIQNSI